MQMSKLNSLLEATRAFDKKETSNFTIGCVHCCDMSQNDTIGKIELIPSSILSSKSANSRNDIQ